jgi:hypothetical protein
MKNLQKNKGNTKRPTMGQALGLVRKSFRNLQAHHQLLYFPLYFPMRWKKRNEATSQSPPNQSTNEPGDRAESGAEQLIPPSPHAAAAAAAAATDHGHGRILPADVGVPRRRLPQDLHLPQGLLHRYVPLPLLQ